MIVKRSDKRDSQRGSENLWLNAAYQTLLESGVDAVRVMSLAKTLSLSRTSFYWHFEDRDALLAALVKCWQDKNTGNLVSQTRLYAETITEAVFNLFDCCLNSELFDAKLDFAIRNWASQSEQLKTVVDRMDLERINAIQSMFKRLEFDDAEAETRAFTIYYTQVGYIALMVDEPIADRVKKMPAYIEIYTGSYPSEHEIKRFNSRHLGNFKQ